MAPVLTYDPVSGDPSPYGLVSMAVEQVAGSKVSGTWSLEQQGSTLQSGTWSLDTDPIVSTEALHYLNLDLSGQGPASGGYFTVYRNTRRSGAEEWTGYAVGLTADGVQFWTGDGNAVPIPALPAAPGSWFTVPVTTYDNATSAYVPFGALTLGVGAASEGSRSGTWSVKDLGAAERGAGTWDVSQ
jgi:hypothetical protein